MVGTITVTNSTATYAWNTGETTASIVNPTTNTTYTVTATDGNCVATDDVDIIITPNPTVNLGNDVAICQGDSTLLDAGSGHTIIYGIRVKLPKPSMPILLGRIM